MSKYKIVTNQVEYSLVSRSIEEDLIPFCLENRITVTAFTPLAEGLSQLRSKDRHGALSKVAAATGRTEVQVALNWCISQESVIAIPRSNSVPHIEENCLASGWRLSPEDKMALDQAFQ